MICRHSFEPRNNTRLAHLCGSVDEHLRRLEQLLSVSISRRNEFFRIEGPKPAASHAMNTLLALYEQADRPISSEQVQLALVQVGAGLPQADAPPGEAQPALRTRRPDVFAGGGGAGGGGFGGGPQRQLTGEKGTGTVKFFNAMKGFGFIQRDDGQPDAFVHISAVERAGMSGLNEGDRVSFDVEVDRRGKQAAVNLAQSS